MTQIKDFWLSYAIDSIYSDTGDIVSEHNKHKDLLKFGSNPLVGTDKATVMSLPSGVLSETLLTSNGIDTISSSSGSDTSTVLIEGHTLSGGNFTFAVQTATLNGQSKVTLTTPLARISRIKNTSASNLVGNVYGYEDTAISAGTPTDGTKVHAIIPAGENNTEKAATTTSSVDYWIITNFYADCLRKSAGFAGIKLEVAEQGQTFITKVEISANTGGRGEHDFKPYLIVKPNSDIRLTAKAAAANTPVSGGIQGILIKAI